jgi:hypothetical protein
MPVCALQVGQQVQDLLAQVTSSAVVGSSASSSRGLQASAMAIMARCRWPPESWCGKALARRSGSGMPVAASKAMAPCQAWRALSPS